MTPEHSSEKDLFKHGQRIEAELSDVASSDSDEKVIDFNNRVGEVGGKALGLVGKGIAKNIEKLTGVPHDDIVDVAKDGISLSREFIESDEGKKHVESVKKVGGGIFKKIKSFRNEATKSVEQTLDKNK